MSRDRVGARSDESTRLLNGHRQPESNGSIIPSYGSRVGSHDGRRSSIEANGNLNPRVELRKSLVLLLGVFLANSDSAIVLASFRQIASEFNKLHSASWIVTSNIFGLVVAQPLYGRLSDIYGRKPLLLFAYSCYCVGGILSGTGFSFWGLLLGRGLAGVGSAGITVLVSTLIVDLVPIREVAVWRGYVYAINQLGRAIGPSLGGLIADNSDWRWSLLFQVPLSVLSLVFICWKINLPSPNQKLANEGRQMDSGSKFRRIDFLGAISLGCANGALLLFFDAAQRNVDFFKTPYALFQGGLWLAFMIAFILVEGFWATEPILPLRLMIQRNVLSSYLIQFLQTAAQMALFTSVPLYFRISNGDSNTVVSIRLLFITFGTILGGLVSGFVIKRTGRYRRTIWVSLILSNMGFLTVFLRWRGSTSWLETAYGAPIGVGFGVSLSAAFVGLTAGLQRSKIAVSTSGFYLSLSLGSLFGVSIASLLIQSSVLRDLGRRLQGIDNKTKIIRDVTTDLGNIKYLTGKVKSIVLDAYVQSLTYVWLFSLVCGCLAFAATFIMLEGQLESESSAPEGASNDCDTPKNGEGCGSQALPA